MRRAERRLSIAVRQNLSDIGPIRQAHLSKKVLLIRWAIDELIYYHLMLDSTWNTKARFLEVIDINAITLDSATVNIVGEYFWWPMASGEGILEWWPNDRTPDTTKRGAKYMTEPFAANVFLLKGKRRPVRYTFEFGCGSTYRIFANMRESLIGT